MNRAGHEFVSDHKTIVNILEPCTCSLGQAAEKRIWVNGLFPEVACQAGVMGVGW